MKFADRYEILEIVTSGRVSTFIGRDQGTQEPVVVYAFECPGTSIAELSAASIIARFALVAPSPPGAIVKTGFDQPSCSAFITTKMPDPAALQEWVQAYHSLGKTGTSSSSTQFPRNPVPNQTAELNQADLSSLIGQTGSAPKQPGVDDSPTWSTNSPAPSLQGDGEFTRLLKNANAFEPVHRSEPLSPPKPDIGAELVFGQELNGRRLGGEASDLSSGGSSPESFTRVFRGISNPQAGGGSGAPAQNEPSTFTQEFLAASDAGATPAGAARQASESLDASLMRSTFSEWRKPGTPVDRSEGIDRAKGETGEFTQFFRDPLDTPRRQDTPIVEPGLTVPDRAQEPQTGDFTRMFGREDRAPSPATGSAEPSAPGLGTQLFGDNSLVRASQPESSFLGSSVHSPSSLPKPTDLTPQAVPAPPVPPPVDPFGSHSTTPAPPLRAEDQTLGYRRASSSTEIFRQGMHAPPMEEVPAGPSEFTVFVSRSQVPSVPPPDTAPPSANPLGGIQAPAFAPPPMPQAIPFTPPKPPPLPAMPAPPPLPQIPKLAGAASYWPLITGLTALFAVAALLIMYFVMRH